MKILIVGLGSIGRRHLNNLNALGGHDFIVVTRSLSKAGAYPNIPFYTTIETALSDFAVDAAFVCSPTSAHVGHLRSLLIHHVPRIYLEKPVSHNLDDLMEVQQLILEKEARISVGFDLRFDPGYQKVQEILSTGVLGKVISFNAIAGQYLPDWRPHEDYRSGMSASVTAGGGVLLDLVHELDYLYSFFGAAKSIACLNRKTGVLAIETEDVADLLIKFESGVIGTLHLDYLQPKLVRNCLITCAAGSIYWNLAEQYVEWNVRREPAKRLDYQGFERNDRFKAILTHFLTEPHHLNLVSFQEGCRSLEMVVAAKQSSLQGGFVDVHSIFNTCIY